MNTEVTCVYPPYTCIRGLQNLKMTLPILIPAEYDDTDTDTDIDIDIDIDIDTDTDTDTDTDISAGCDANHEGENSVAFYYPANPYGLRG